MGALGAPPPTPKETGKEGRKKFLHRMSEKRIPLKRKKGFGSAALKKGSSRLSSPTGRGEEKKKELPNLPGG